MTRNLAMIGTGRIADDELAPALKQVNGAQLWSVLSRDQQRAAQFAARHGAAAADPAHTSLETLLADPALDGIIIASPDKLHAEQTIAAARAGKHVLVEKPMATSNEDALAMVGACKEAGVRLAVAYHLRWHQGHRKIAQMIHDGKLGTPHHARALWSWPAADASNWRAGKDVGRWWSLGGVGTHCLDAIRWMFMPACGEITTLKSVIDRSRWSGPHDETAVLALQFESGATAEICTSVLFRANTRLELYCSDGFAVCDKTLGPHGAGKIHVNDQPLEFAVENPYAGEIQNFVEAMDGENTVEVAGNEGARNIELLLEAVDD